MIVGVFGYWWESGWFIVFEVLVVVFVIGGIGKLFKVIFNFWEYIGDGYVLVLWVGVMLINMEFV